MKLVKFVETKNVTKEDSFLMGLSIKTKWVKNIDRFVYNKEEDTISPIGVKYVLTIPKKDLTKTLEAKLIIDGYEYEEEENG